MWHFPTKSLTVCDCINLFLGLSSQVLRVYLFNVKSKVREDGFEDLKLNLNNLNKLLFLVWKRIFKIT